MSLVRLLFGVTLIIALSFQPVLHAAAEEQRIPMGAGWNLISLNVDPRSMYIEGEDRGPNVPLMFEQLQREDRHLVTWIYDQVGLKYGPGAVDEIAYWDLSRGYQISVKSACELVFEGERIPADTPIELHEGLNFISYYPEYQLSCSRNTFYALVPILEHVVLAKDGFGHFMFPRNNSSNMDPWRPGRGYQVLVDTACTLVYLPPLSVEPTIELPTDCILASPYPNPFNAITNISFTLYRPGAARLTIYNSSGRAITELLNSTNLPSGNHNVTWDAGDLPSGVYIIRLESESASTMKRAILIR